MNNDIKQILDKVQKPGRYIGCEVNSVHKEFTPSRVSVVLAYPDTYEIGMSYLGMRILYHLLNEDEDILCERVFMPWTDMKDEIIAHDKKLFSLESKTDLNKFDIVGFSLSYELTFTNVLSMLDLGGITLRAKDRAEEDPLVIAGGSCCYNPEPMSLFFDAIVIGDGEESLPGLVKNYKKLKSSGMARKDILRELSAIKGVYVPSLYKAEYADGSFSGIKPEEEGIPQTIEKAFIEDFENAYYPEKQIIPLIRIVHDRIPVEIMRGCPNPCRFCQAGVINRPVRLRSVERIREICRKAYAFTGNERIAFLSLSSVNYPYLKELVKAINEDFKGKGVGISVPSLRIDEAFYELPEMIAAIRKAGLTFAPETASESLRRSIGKDISMDVLRKSAVLAYKNGWRRLKLYFMVGFPGEVEKEAENILDLARELSGIKREVSKGAAEVKISVNPFIPKPHTSMQWIGMEKEEDLREIKTRLARGSSKKIKVEFHDINQSIIEGALARGDRRMAEVIASAWERGASMDGWSEFFNIDTWKDAFTDNGMDLHECAYRYFPLDKPLPWSHISSGTKETKLKEELESSGLYQVHPKE